MAIFQLLISRKIADCRRWARDREGKSLPVIYTVLIKRFRLPLSFFFLRKLLCGHGTPRGSRRRVRVDTRRGPLTSSYAPDLLSLSLLGSLSLFRTPVALHGTHRSAGMAFRIGGLPIFSPIKIPSRLPHDGLPARHSRFKLTPTTTAGEREEKREDESARERVSASQLVPRRP